MPLSPAGLNRGVAPNANSDMDKQLEEYRTHLVEARQKAFEDFDKTVLALSGGALGVSFAFVKDLVGPGPLSCKSCLLTAWICWGTSVVTVLISYFSSQLALDRSIAEVDAGSRPRRPGGVFWWLTTILNALGGLLFLLGLILLIVFVSHNLEALNVRPK
jgi:hypothetical protein